MLFTWKQIPTGYEYSTEDKEVFGSIKFRSSVELTPDECDSIVTTLLKDPSGAGTVKGALMLARDDEPISIYYTFKKKPQWEDDSTSTKTKKQVQLTLWQRLLRSLVNAPRRIISFCTKFAAAFREALQRAKE